MEVVFCVMKEKELFAIYKSKVTAENIAEQMSEKTNEIYHVETRQVF